jgi:glycosyltransferase involved in cell wall biosynthesis
VSRIGFACLWASNPIATWSHIPWHLRAAMRDHAEVPDVGVQIPHRMQTALKLMHVRWRNSRPVTTWKQSRLTDSFVRQAIQRGAEAADADAILMIQDLAIVDRPYFTFQDMSFDGLLHIQETSGIPLFQNLTGGELRRRRERQLEVYDRAAGVIAMSHWLARNLIEVTGVPAAKVHVVHPGISAGASVEGPLPEKTGPRNRLLFVGREFTRKGGDLVVAALAILRRDFDPEITLTVAGPREWPMEGEIPDGVRFLGERTLAEVAGLYDTHDLFVLPSRLEAFGIVFAEAAARGVPAIGRDAFAMPEVIQPGVSGALASGDDPSDLAKLIAETLADDNLYAECRARAGDVSTRFSWDRAGREVVDAIDATLNAR